MKIYIETNGSRRTIAEPLCGSDWLRQHLRDHTHADIEALAIEVSCNGHGFCTVRSGATKGTVRDLVKLRKGD